MSIKQHARSLTHEVSGSAIYVTNTKLAIGDERSVNLAGVRMGFITMKRVGNRVVAEYTTPGEQEELK